MGGEEARHPNEGQQHRVERLCRPVPQSPSKNALARDHFVLLQVKAHGRDRTSICRSGQGFRGELGDAIVASIFTHADQGSGERAQRVNEILESFTLNFQRACLTKLHRETKLE